MLDDVIKHLATRDILHDHEDVRWRGDHLIQLDYVGVAKQLQNLNFPVNFLSDVHLFYLLPVQNFDGYSVPCELMLSEFHLAKATVACHW